MKKIIAITQITVDGVMQGGFGNGIPPRRLTLVQTRSTPAGVLVNTYHPAGPLPRGSAETETR